MLAEVVRDQIRSEMHQIDDLLAAFAPLLQRALNGQPDVVDCAALGSVLHSFYTGIEGIFLTVAKRVDGSVPGGDRWHRDLMDQVAAPTATHAAADQGVSRTLTLSRGPSTVGPAGDT